MVSLGLYGSSEEEIILGVTHSQALIKDKAIDQIWIYLFGFNQTNMNK